LAKISYTSYITRFKDYSNIFEKVVKIIDKNEIQSTFSKNNETLQKVSKNIQFLAICNKAIALFNLNKNYIIIII
jgi:hypothetical protein